MQGLMPAAGAATCRWPTAAITSVVRSGGAAAAPGLAHFCSPAGLAEPDGRSASGFTPPGHPADAGEVHTPALVLLAGSHLRQALGRPGSARSFTRLLPLPRRREWNANAKNCHAAQAMLQAVLRQRHPQVGTPALSVSQAIPILPARVVPLHQSASQNAWASFTIWQLHHPCFYRDAGWRRVPIAWPRPAAAYRSCWRCPACLASSRDCCRTPSGTLPAPTVCCAPPTFVTTSWVPWAAWRQRKARGQAGTAAVRGRPPRPARRGSRARPRPRAASSSSGRGPCGRCWAPRRLRPRLRHPRRPRRQQQRRQQMGRDQGRKTQR